MKLNEIYKEFAEKLNEIGYDEDMLVYGDGDENSPVMLIGEAPGKDEVILKRPFAGKAGKNLDEFLSSTGINRSSLFISNTVKFRPYKIGSSGRKSNRPPTKEEIAICADCLRKEIECISPKLIVTLGNTALKAVCGAECPDNKLTVSECHGRIVEGFSEYKVFSMYHPASIIYRRELAEVYAEDMKKLSELIKEYGIK